MAHIHGVFDSDTHFVIDPITRHLKNETSKKASVVQFDHDSERFTFELPRIIEGHDMTTCNVVQVHYLNIEAKTKIENKGLYEVDDLQISPEDENTVICSWLISQNATQLDGSISFLVRFSCVNEGEPNYIWQTAPYTAITVTTGINNADYVAEEFPPDLIEQWRNQLENIYEGQQGEPGKSAYEIAVENGFEGSEEEWLESLKGVGGGSLTNENYLEKVEKLPTNPKENELVALTSDEVFDWDNVEYTESLDDVKEMYNVRFSTLPETLDLSSIKGKNIASEIVFYNITTNQQIMFGAHDGYIQIAFNQESNRLWYFDAEITNEDFTIPSTSGWYKGYENNFEEATSEDLKILNGIYNVFIVDFGELAEGGSSIIDSSISYILDILVKRIVVPINKGLYVAENGKWLEFATSESLPDAEGVAF